MIKPTVGRVVWFWRDVKETQHQPFAASISFVHGDRMVNLGYLDHNGTHKAATSVHLVQAGDEAQPTTYFCEWMPYQQGQAAKTEALEKKLAG